MRVVTMLHVEGGLDESRDAASRRAVARASDEVAGVRRSHLGRHYPGTVGL